MKTRSVMAALVGVLALSTGLAACTTEQPAPTPTTSAAPASSSAEALKARAALLAQYPDAKVPKVSQISQVTLDDLPTKRAACMTKQGFPTTVTADGGQQGFVPQGQDEAYQIASLVCILEFPLEQKYQNPLSDAQFKVLYAYETTTLANCLRAHGYEVSPAPSFETFKDTYGGAKTWTAYDHVNASGDKWAEVNRECPQIPSNLYK